MEILEVAKNLKQQVDIFGGAEAHIVVNDIQGAKSVTAVMSVYKGVKPSHMVLNELYDWAGETNNIGLIEKINELSEDMSWNEKD